MRPEWALSVHTSIRPANQSIHSTSKPFEVWLRFHWNCLSAKCPLIVSKLSTNQIKTNKTFIETNDCNVRRSHVSSEV
ncbi:MAG: hypothetical protein ACTS43_00615 [Candidatus Hodgkinia cicadicola]